MCLSRGLWRGPAPRVQAGGFLSKVRCNIWSEKCTKNIVLRGSTFLQLFFRRLLGSCQLRGGGGLQEGGGLRRGGRLRGEGSLRGVRSGSGLQVGQNSGVPAQKCSAFYFNPVRVQGLKMTHVVHRRVPDHFIQFSPSHFDQGKSPCKCLGHISISLREVLKSVGLDPLNID